MIFVEDRQSQFGMVTIYRRRATGALIYDQLGCSQSEADSNGISLASYVHAIYGLVLQTSAKSVLMIGCGGGTLGTMLAAAGCEVSIVDINPNAFVLARRHFGLPDRITCHIADGAAHLMNETRCFDAVILDAYHGAEIPPHLCTAAFFHSTKLRLTPHGALFANIHVLDDDDLTADAIAQSTAETFDLVRLLDAPGFCNRNAILMAGEISQLTQPQLHVCPSEQSDQITFELSTLQLRTWKTV